MPTVPPPEWITAGLVVIYQETELDILRQLAETIHELDGDNGGNSRRRQSALAQLRNRTNRIVRVLHQRVLDEVPRTVADAVNWGDRSALADIGRLLGDDTRLHGIVDQSITERLTHELVGALSPAHQMITQIVTETYQQVGEDSMTAVSELTGALHRRDETKKVLNELSEHGITGFIDRRGRKWDLITYAEMRARTTVARAAIDSHLARLSAAGIGLVWVSDSPRECGICRPWEGKVLSIGGSGGTSVQQVPSAVTGDLVKVGVAGSVASARLAGLFHPGCRHFLTAYLPGKSKLPTNTEDPLGYQNEQKLRAMERRMRQLRRAEVLSNDAADRTNTRRKIKNQQALIRQHVRRADLTRQLVRERLGEAR